MKPADFTSPSSTSPTASSRCASAKMLGFTKEQIEPGWLCPSLGNTYSGSSPIGLTAILDVAKPGDKILMGSYGSGSGSDAFICTVTERIHEVQDLAPHDRATARQQPDLSGVRQVREVPRQDPQGRVGEAMRDVAVIGVGMTPSAASSGSSPCATCSSRPPWPPSTTPAWTLDSMYPSAAWPAACSSGQEHVGALLADYLGRGAGPGHARRVGLRLGRRGLRGRRSSRWPRARRHRARRRRREDDRRRRRRGDLRAGHRRRPGVRGLPRASPSRASTP